MTALSAQTRNGDNPGMDVLVKKSDDIARKLNAIYDRTNLPQETKLHLLQAVQHIDELTRELTKGRQSE